MPRKRPGEQDKGTELVLRDESKVRKTSSWMRQTESKQWEVVLDEDRKRSLDAWVLLVLDNPGASVAGTLIQQEDQDGQLSVLADIFRAKATATLRARASALLAYMRWGRAEHGRTFTLFPVKEVVVYEYLCFLRDTRSPPTKAERFVQALAFCKGTLQADVDNVLASSRIKGATIPIEGHRVVRKKRPLTVAQVADLERRASTDESATGVFCGYLCFLVHGRLRWSDGQYVAEEPTIDTCPDGAGSLEAGLYYHKTANRQKSVIRRLLPAACSLPGVSGLPWAQTWLQNRAKHGLRAKKGCPMMPAPLASGKWDSIPLGTAEAIVWMKEVLQDAQGDVGTHSCKATALSWMAKANVDRHIRRLGGYHVAPGDRSMTEYSRDAQSPVLHALSGLYLAIRGGLFSPDASRSGRWNGYHNLEDAVKVLAAAPSLPVDGEPTGEGDSSGDSSGKSTSSSSSEGEEVDDEVVRADQAMAVLAAPAQLEQEDMAFYLLNVKSQVAHIPRPGTYGDEDGEMEGKVQFMTSQEAEYPSLLCKHTVDCILQELRRRGRNFQACPTLHDSAIALANFKQPRGLQAPTLLSEFQYTVQVLVSAGEKPPAVMTSPSGPWSQDALQLTHPFDNPLIVSEQNRCTINWISSVSPADAAEWRLGQLRKYLRLAVELSSDEARLHEGLHPDLEPVLQGKRLLLFKAMMEDAGVADPFLFQHMVDGFLLVGHLEPSGQFPKRWKPARLTLESLKKTSHWARKAALSSCAKGAADQQIADAVWSETQDQLQRGWLKGPFTEADLDVRNSGVWIPSRRFGVKQGVDKIRCVDDFSEFLLNEATATSEKLVLEGLDDIVALARFWLSECQKGGLTDADLASLKGKLLYAAGHTFGKATQLAVQLLGRQAARIKQDQQRVLQAVLEVVDVLAAARPRWASSGSRQLIGQAEIYPVVLAKATWAGYLAKRKVIWFIDNESARAAFIRSFSPVLHSVKLLWANARLDVRLELWNWYARVPSKSNFSDAASRLEFGCYQGWKQVEPCYEGVFA
ncbi:unnamed protein product [Effrenium voratum]|nr:unnamed protein product [Effrenium voratum]